jgi:hypothetical protein
MGDRLLTAKPGGTREFANGQAAPASGAEHPFVKYVWTGGTLETHLYVRFLFADLDWVKVTDALGFPYWSESAKVTDARKAELESWYREGVAKYFGGLRVGGTVHDFPRLDANGRRSQGAAFNTKVVIHEVGDVSPGPVEVLGARKLPLDPAQKYIEVTWGYPGKNPAEGHWYWGSFVPFFNPHDESKDWTGIANITLAYENQVLRDKDLLPNVTRSPYGSKEGMMSVCAHETGHVLGLADAYSQTVEDTVNGVVTKSLVDKMRENGETTRANGLSGSNANSNLMKTSGDATRVLGNDLEMMLWAYRSSPYEIQYYSDYVLHVGDDPKKLSPVIDIRDDCGEKKPKKSGRC